MIVSVVRNRNGQVETSPDVLAVEEPLEIRLIFGDRDLREEKTLAITMRTPGNDFELAAGFLFTEGIITHPSDILSIRHCETAPVEARGNIVKVNLAEHILPDWNKLQRNFYTTSSCGVCGKSSIEAVETTCPISSAPVPHFDLNILHELPNRLNQAQIQFKHTGGIHASGLFTTDGELLFAAEDVGRHNALDKLIGAAFMAEKTPLENHILLLSGRVSFELMQKAAIAGIRVVAAIGAPSSLAHQMAQSYQIQLFGFLRNGGWNQYT